MKTIDKVYIDGAFVTPHGSELFNLINPTTNELIGSVVLGDEIDTKTPFIAQKKPLVPFPKLPKQNG
ncbi:acyl-CoA reductase-like NAD-dependent aldehyde dehydrogenase [Pedobacter sp. UYP30]|uniref:hypothetical protein n=1 Tax=Pedobacter sp. UYP30 TaxID=1756400 RepID=UPI0033912DD5